MKETTWIYDHIRLQDRIKLENQEEYIVVDVEVLPDEGFKGFSRNYILKSVNGNKTKIIEVRKSKTLPFFLVEREIR